MIAVLHVDTYQDAQLACEIAYTRPDHREEDFNYCVLRERGLELKHLLDTGTPYALICGRSIETLQILSHNLPGKLTKETLMDLRWRYRGALNKVFMQQVQPNEPHYQQILHWPLWCPKEVLARAVSVTDFVEFVKASRLRSWGDALFIKTVEKGEPSRTYRLTSIFSHDDWCRRTKLPQERPDALSYASKRPQPGDGFIQDNPQPYFNEYHGEMEHRAPAWYAMSGKLIVSEPLDIHKDEHGTLEYRCFVVDNKVTSISRYLDYETPEVPAKVCEFAEQVVRRCATIGKEGPGPDYVVDVALTSRGCVVIEFNPLPCSGRYYGNSAKALFDAFFAGCTRVDSIDTPPELPKQTAHIMLLEDDPILQLRNAMAAAKDDDWLDI